MNLLQNYLKMMEINYEKIRRIKELEDISNERARQTAKILDEYYASRGIKQMHIPVKKFYKLYSGYSNR